MGPIVNGGSYSLVIAFEVSKVTLTVHFHPEGQLVVIENTCVAITKVLSHCKTPSDRLIICKASGGYTRKALLAAWALELPIHRAHRTRTRNFARYLGLASKTDAIDAQMLALFAAKSDALRLGELPNSEL